MSKRAAPLVLVFALVALAAVRVARLWAELPPVVATHYGPGGEPNSWLPKTSFAIIFGAIFVIVLALFAVMPLWLRRLPAHLVKLPHPEYWRTKERLPVAMARLTVWMDWFAVALAALFVVAFELVLRANLRHGPLHEVAMTWALVGFLAFTILWMLGLYRSFRPPDA